MAGSPAATLAVAVPVAIALIGGIVKAAGLRGEVHREWGSRIGDLTAGVDEFAFQQLRNVYKRIGPWLYTGQGFWPAGPPPNPNDLAGLIAKYTRAIRFKSRLSRDVTVLMWVGPITIVSLAVGLAATVAISLHRIHLVEMTRAAEIGYGLAIGCAAGAIACLGAYVVLRHRLTSVALLADKGGCGA